MEFEIKDKYAKQILAVLRKKGIKPVEERKVLSRAWTVLGKEINTPKKKK